MRTVHREKWCAIFNMFLCATFNTTHLSVPFLYATTTDLSTTHF